MIRRFLAPALTAVLLGACSPSGQEAATTPPVAPDAPSAPAAPPAEAASPTPPATLAPAASASVGAAAPSAATAAQAPLRDPNAPPPRLGTDFEVLAAPQPTWNPSDPRIEIAEVFSYMCHVCAEVQPSIDLYKPTLPADARWVYVPAPFGGPWDQATRAYFTAEALGMSEQVHSRVFPAIFVEKKIQRGTPEEFADLYAGFGADRARFLATMSSFGITAKLNRAKQFSLRAGVNGTPTIVVNGKYRVMNTRDRGIQGMLDTVNYLIERERAAAAAPAAPAAAPAAAS